MFKRRSRLQLLALVATTMLCTQGVEMTAAQDNDNSTSVKRCKLSNLSCRLDGGKCNIKFKNRTGIAKRMCDIDSDLSWAEAKTVFVATRLGGTRVGRKRSIAASASLTINLDKRDSGDGFDKIRVSGGSQMANVTLECEDIKDILERDAGCNIYYQMRAGNGGGGYEKRLVVACDKGRFCYRNWFK